MKKFLLLSVLFLSTIFPALAHNRHVSADTFNPNVIINDAIYDNSGSMTAKQIDSFLNSFLNSCISINSGFKAIDPTGYNPTTGYQYGGFVSAGQVIKDSSTAYSINPEVLLATLQKEQSLVAGGANFCSNGDNNKYAAAVGYGCPDSGTTYNYNNANLFQRNGVTVTSTGPTCVNSIGKAGFSQQVIRAAWLLKFGEQRSEGNTAWAVINGSWDNSDDPQTCYGGPMTQGTWQRCPSGGSTYYDGYTTIDNTAVHMDDGATAALYWYTPHFSGNQSFYNIFVSWFGSPIGCPGVDSSYSYRLHNTNNGDYLYTQNPSEICQAVKYYGYRIEGKAMQPLLSTDANSVPLYRLSRQGTHFYTTSSVERDMAIQQYGFSSEGIAYNVGAATASGLYPTYRLSKNGTYFYTLSDIERDMMLNSGYSNQGIAYYVNSSSTKVAVYRLSKNGIHLYTSSMIEHDMAISSGYSDEGIGYYAQAGPTGDDLTTFRLVRAGHYLFTTSLGEELLALQSGYQLETSNFNVYPANYPPTVPVYRLSNARNGDYLYTQNSAERDQAVALYGYKYEGTAFGSSP